MTLPSLGHLVGLLQIIPGGLNCSVILVLGDGIGPKVPVQLVQFQIVLLGGSVVSFYYPSAFFSNAVAVLPNRVCLRTTSTALPSFGLKLVPLRLPSGQNLLYRLLGPIWICLHSTFDVGSLSVKLLLRLHPILAPGLCSSLLVCFFNVSSVLASPLASLQPCQLRVYLVRAQALSSRSHLFSNTTALSTGVKLLTSSRNGHFFWSTPKYLIIPAHGDGLYFGQSHQCGT